MLILNCSVGHAVPETSEVTSLPLADSSAETWPGRSGAPSAADVALTTLLADTALLALVALVGDIGALARSDPQATRDTTPKTTAPRVNAVRRFVKTAAPGKSPATRGRRHAMIHKLCQSSAVTNFAC
jgi:hypothetical protein